MDGIFTNIIGGNVVRDSLAHDDLIVPNRSYGKTSISNVEKTIFQISENIVSSAFEEGYVITPELFGEASIGSDYGKTYILERVWVEPLEIPISFIVEDSETPIKVWNAWRSKTVQLTSVTVINQDGTYLEYPSLPDTIAKLGDTTYTMNIYQLGPPLQDTTWRLTIDGSIYSVHISGIRVLAFSPDMNWRKTPSIKYEFSSVIYNSDFITEQRRALSDESWISFSFSFSLDSKKNRQIFNLLAFGQDKVFGIPIYIEKMTVESFTVDSVTVNENPSELWNLQNNTNFVILVDHKTGISEIKYFTQIIGNTISFSQLISLSFDVNTTKVYPCMFCIMNGYNATNVTDDYDTVTIEFMEYKSGS